MRRPLLIVALVATLALAGCLREFEEPHHLSVATVDLAAAQVLARDVVLNVTTSLDNRGAGETGDVRLAVRVFSEQTNFLVAENESVVGVIPGDTTRPVSVYVKVPREGGVRVEVTVFEDDQGRQRATVSARNLGALEPEVVDTGLRVTDIDFLVQGVEGAGGNGSRVRVQTDLYLTNEGRAANEDLRVQVKARELSTSLVADVAWLTTGVIQPATTVIRSVNLTVPDEFNYVFEIVTWRADVIVARHEGTVQLAPTFTKPTDQELVVTNPNVNDFLAHRAVGDAAADAPGRGTRFSPTPAYDAPAAAVPAPGPVGVGLAIAAAAFLATRRWRA